MNPRVVGGRSRCPLCARTLQWFELFPLLSFFGLHGKCRTCKENISIQYPIVEFLTGCIFAGIPLFINYFFGFSNMLFFSLSAPWWQYMIALLWIVIFCIFLLITIIDLKHFIIPNGLNLLLGIFGVLYMGLLLYIRNDIPLFYDSFIRHYAMIFSPFHNVVYAHLFGFLIGGMFFILLALITLGRGIGIGDVKLALALGILLGWPDIILSIMFSFIIGGVISGGLVLVGKRHLKEKVPFAPFFIVGTLLVVFFGYAILRSYFSVFGL
jgi:leader peptidase (prepilin peptidase)/N-methyltransferase